MKLCFLQMFKIIDHYQRKDPGIMAKFKTGKYRCGSFHRGSNNNINLVTCENFLNILLILKG